LQRGHTRILETFHQLLAFSGVPMLDPECTFRLEL
jgi:hypothetical protein